MNTLTGAVSEYTNFAFQSITPTHGGRDTGLYAFGGDLDDTTPIVSKVTTGKTLWGTALKKLMSVAHISIVGTGISTFKVYGATTSNEYTFDVRTPGESRVAVGRGIRENYLAFEYRNTDGADFRLDSFEITLDPSVTRRI